ncbi:MAG: 2-phosphosulfolactate phosphatase [Planctomycetaceae bacterium]|jgi:2-phosphosulfolactate phosphatase|nr:2-phosphosulfolactate phosphatase [Planctomycetaceae bacterium]
MKTINVYPLPSYAVNDDVTDFVAVVIDVLRATTVVVSAFASGAKDVIPMLEIEQARQLKKILEKKHGKGSVLLGGERKGIPIEGFDLGNSPQLVTPEKIAGKILILTTTNGTVAIHAAKKTQHLYVAGLVNAHAVVERLKNEKKIAIFCAGTDEHVTEEDLLLAGCLVSRLSRYSQHNQYTCPCSHPNQNQPQYQWNNHAEKAKQLWENQFFINNNEFVSEGLLVEFLRRSRGGKNLVELSCDADIVAAAKIDSINLVPEIHLQNFPSTM